jgi:acyl dehydratase
VTEDEQFTHLDPVRAAATPFGGTVAHGFLTLSMLSTLAYDALPEIEGATSSVNYGFDRLRFVSPVRAGSRIRASFTLHRAEVTPAHVTLHLDVTMDIDGADRPALAARWITRHILG